jgi:hypothetical protein
VAVFASFLGKNLFVCLFFVFFFFFVSFWRGNALNQRAASFWVLSVVSSHAPVLLLLQRLKAASVHNTLALLHHVDESGRVHRVQHQVLDQQQE